MGDKDNVVVGLQSLNTLKVGNYGDLEAAAVDVGFIKGGVQFEHDEDELLIFVDQAMGAIARKTTKESMKIKLTFSEASLENLAVAFGYPTTAVSSDIFYLGGKTSNTERTLFVNVNSPDAGTRKYTLWKCVPDGKSNHAYKKDGETLIDVSFHVLEDVAKTAEQRFGNIEDTGLDTTPPTIALSTPTDGGTVTKATKGIVVWTITETNQMDENSIVYGDTVSIINITTPASAALVAGSIVYSPTAKTITFTPDAVWTTLESMQAIVTTGLKDLAGNKLAAMKIEQFSVSA